MALCSLPWVALLEQWDCIKWVPGVPAKLCHSGILCNLNFNCSASSFLASKQIVKRITLLLRQSFQSVNWIYSLFWIICEILLPAVQKHFIFISFWFFFFNFPTTVPLFYHKQKYWSKMWGKITAVCKAQSFKEWTFWCFIRILRKFSPEGYNTFCCCFSLGSFWVSWILIHHAGLGCIRIVDTTYQEKKWITGNL